MIHYVFPNYNKKFKIHYVLTQSDVWMISDLKIHILEYLKQKYFRLYPEISFA